jgi:CBS domain containing-hemolysin-like protein
MHILSSLKKIFFKNRPIKINEILETENNKINWNNNLIEITVFDCMVPTKDLIFASVQNTFSQLVDKIQINNDLNDSYILIYNNNFDDLIGIVYESDIIKQFVTKEKKDGCDFLFSDIHFVPYIMDLNLAMNYMHSKNSNLLVVVDSKGVTLGTLSKNSIIDFLYTYEKIAEYFNKNINNNSIEIDGTVLLKHIPEDWQITEFYECYKTGTRTIGGFLGYYSGEILSVNKEIKIKDFSFKVLEGDEKFIKKILITKIDKE